MTAQTVAAKRVYFQLCKLNRSFCRAHGVPQIGQHYGIDDQRDTASRRPTAPPSQRCATIEERHQNQHEPNQAECENTQKIALNAKNMGRKKFTCLKNCLEISFRL